MNRGGHLDLDPKSRSGFKNHPEPDNKLGSGFKLHPVPNEKSRKVGIVSMFPDFYTKSRGQSGLSLMFPNEIGPKASGRVKENLDFPDFVPKLG